MTGAARCAVTGHRLDLNEACKSQIVNQHKSSSVVGMLACGHSAKCAHDSCRFNVGIRFVRTIRKKGRTIMPACLAGEPVRIDIWTDIAGHNVLKVS